MGRRGGGGRKPRAVSIAKLRARNISPEMPGCESRETGPRRVSSRAAPSRSLSRERREVGPVPTTRERNIVGYRVDRRSA